MANKNIFKNHIKVFQKSAAGKVLIERNDDLYFISDGYTLLRIPEIIYNTEIRPLDVMFIELENGETATRRAGDRLSEKAPGNNSRCLLDAFERTKADQPVNISKFTYSTMAEKRDLRLAIITGKPVFYDDSFIRAAWDYCGKFTATADRYPALKWDDETIGIGCVILPVHNKAALDALDAVQQMGEA